MRHELLRPLLVYKKGETLRIREGKKVMDFTNPNKAHAELDRQISGHREWDQRYRTTMKLFAAAGGIMAAAGLFKEDAFLLGAGLGVLAAGVRLSSDNSIFELRADQRDFAKEMIDDL